MVFDLWRARLAREGRTTSEIKLGMQTVNPVYIPRNHRIEAAISGDFAPFRELREVLSQPFTARPQFARYEEPPLEHERVQATFCGTKGSKLKIVNGASLQPRSGGRPKQIILLLHGFGSNGHDMISLAPTWQQALLDALFLAPHAPQRSIAGIGYQWWALYDISPRALAFGTVSAAPAIEAFIDRKLDQYGLADADLAIVGFSQGTMMALHVGLRRKQRVAAIVG